MKWRNTCGYRPRYRQGGLSVQRPPDDPAAILDYLEVLMINDCPVDAQVMLMGQLQHDSAFFSDEGTLTIHVVKRLAPLVGGDYVLDVDHLPHWLRIDQMIYVGGRKYSNQGFYRELQREFLRLSDQGTTGTGEYVAEVLLSGVTINEDNLREPV